jgi:hypothetical protein
MALPSQFRKVSGGQTIIQQKPPGWWQLDSRKADSVAIDCGRYDYTFYFSPQTREVYVYERKTY